MAMMVILLLNPLVFPVIGTPSQAPAMEVTVNIEPEEVEVFPTRTWSMPLYFLASVALEKYRPDDVYVDLVCTVDNDWMIEFNPRVMLFSRVGTVIHNCEITLMVPPRTVGPLTVTIELTASVRVVGRTIEDTGQSVITFIEDSDQFMDKVPERIVVQGDGGVDGEMRVFNLHDEDLEFHLSALDEWDERIPDLDFQNPLVLGPNQMQEVRFHGQLKDEVEMGEYEIEIALWTPSEDGNRTYVTSKNVTLVVKRIDDSFFSSILTFGIVVLVIGLVALAGFVFVLLRGGRGQLQLGNIGHRLRRRLFFGKSSDMPPSLDKESPRVGP
jgi:hypothetical protein